MANCRTAIKLSLILIVCLIQIAWGRAGNNFLDEPADSVDTDSLVVSEEIDTIENDVEGDSSFIGPIDPTLFKPVFYLPEPEKFEPVYKTYITQKGLGDIIRYNTGVFVLQHGLVGQPEMITKSLMLPGAQAIYNGTPVFQQGSYFPFRSGADLTALMSDNISDLEITRLSYLSLFSEGQVLSLKSSAWPSENNPSSITHAKGPYDYERTTWRFSRQFGTQVGATFTAAFKEYTGYYISGGDYDDFRVSGSVSWRPKSNAELNYSFYQHKAKQAVIQFDRMVMASMRSNNDINHHTMKGLYQYSNSLLLTMDTYYQYNYNHLYDDMNDLSYRVRDQIWGSNAGAEIIRGNNNLKINAGWRRQALKDISTYEPISSTFGFLISDSLQLSENRSVILSGRARYNNKSDFGFSGAARYRINNIIVSGGVYNSQPDLYAMYYSPPTIVFSNESYITSYTYDPNPAIKSKRTLFGAGSINLKLPGGLSANLGISYENVVNDLVPELSNVDSAFSSTQKNIDYDRITLTADLNYHITRYFTGTTGVSYFNYDPSEVLPGIEHSPSLVAFSRGEIMIPEVLRDIDISGAFQARYYSKRCYSGFIDEIIGTTTYNRAIVVDGSLAMQFGSFEFRISEDNIADFFVDNKYSLWGEYSMPPAVVWWQFTWEFEN